MKGIIEYNALRKRYYEVKSERNVRRWARHILESHNIPLTNENVEGLTETIMRGVMGADICHRQCQQHIQEDIPEYICRNI